MNRLTVEEFHDADKMPLVVVLDDVRSLHNVGSVFRTADAFRVEEIMLCGITGTPPRTTPIGSENSSQSALSQSEKAGNLHEKTGGETMQKASVLYEKTGGEAVAQAIHKTALGAEDSVAWRYFPTAMEAVESLKSDGYTVLAVEQVHGSTMLQDFKAEKGKKYAVILGNEVKGVHQEVIDICDGCLEIPQFGTKHSLNVSVTGGIIIWHFAQQIFS